MVFYNSLSLFLHSTGWFGGVGVILVKGLITLPARAVFGSSSSLPPLDSEGGGLVFGKADLSDRFNSKQFRETVDLPLTCHPSPSFTIFAFRSSEVRRLLLDLDPYAFTDPLGMFPLFLRRTSDVLAHRLSVMSRRLVRLCSFPAC